MSQHSPSTVTRRSVLAGTAAGLASTALFPMLSGANMAANAAPVADMAGSHRLCAAHHAELANHLKGILNSSYVDERMKNKVLTNSRCPHCDVAIAPDQMNQASFAAL
ncbi:MAG: hypothetical protein ABJH63_01920 [Rhizobiaceae bacterium]